MSEIPGRNEGSISTEKLDHLLQVLISQGQFEGESLMTSVDTNRGTVVFLSLSLNQEQVRSQSLARKGMNSKNILLVAEFRAEEAAQVHSLEGGKSIVAGGTGKEPNSPIVWPIRSASIGVHGRKIMTYTGDGLSYTGKPNAITKDKILGAVCTGTYELIGNFT